MLCCGVRRVDKDRSGAISVDELQSALSNGKADGSVRGGGGKRGYLDRQLYRIMDPLQPRDSAADDWNVRQRPLWYHQFPGVWGPVEVRQ